MDALKLHILVNYYPAIGMVLATIALIAGLWLRNVGLTRSVLKLLVLLSLLTLVVAFSGEFASWSADWYTGARKEALASHKISGTVAFAATMLTGIAAVIALVRGRDLPEKGRWAVVATLLLAVVASAVLVLTIFKGRQIKWAGTAAVVTVAAEVRS